MTFPIFRRFFTRLALISGLAGALFFASHSMAQQPLPLDQQDAANAARAMDEGKLEEAAGLYEGIPVKYPTSALIPQAKLRLGYVYFRMQQYDKAVAVLTEATTLKNVPPEVAELALSLVPQVLSAKAAAAGPKDPQRKKLFEDAVKGFETFQQKYPNSDEQENANYGRAVAFYQLERYDDARAALYINLTKYSKSETVFDSQYLMALTLGTIANVEALKDKPDPKVLANFDNAEMMLMDIVNKGTDVALANDSRFQIGELRFSRAGSTKDEARRKELFKSAMDVYRVVGPKDLIIQAQKARIDRVKGIRPAAIASRDPAQIRRVNRLFEKEQEKLANIESRPDQTIAARIKMGEVYFQLGKMDETRVMLNYMKGLTEDEDQKKQIAYYIAISLAQQNSETHANIKALADRAEAAYEEFKKAYGVDPIAENLALILGAGFTDKDPAKASKYLEEQTKNFPNSKLVATGDQLRAAVMINQGQFEEAYKIFKELLAKNPPTPAAAAAEFGMATVLLKEKKSHDAIPVFKAVRDKYPGTDQSVQAAFFYGQLLQETNDSKAALPELQKFVKDHPQHSLIPTALFYLAQAQAGVNQHAEAMATYKRIAEEYPQADVAPYTYFQRATLLMGDQKMDDVVPLMQEFMKKYPDDKALYQAYDFVAQIQGNQKKEEDAIATYEEFAKLKPEDPMAAQALLQVGTKWKAMIDQMQRYITLSEEQRKTWTKVLDDSINASERVVRLHPESTQVALALGLLLDDLKLRVSAKLMTEDELAKHFEKLAAEFKGKPSTHSKIIFTLAGNLIEKDKDKALKLMAGVYNPELKYAPEDMDLYGTGLIDEKKLDDAVKVYEKLAKDYPIPDNSDPTKAPRDIQEAQSMSLFGLGKVLQEQGKVAEAKVKFDELEKLYGWSPKMLAANLGISMSLYNDKQYDDALKRLTGIIRAPKAPPELRAKAMLLLSHILEDTGKVDDAINNYIKINAMYQSVPKVAAEGLWRGAQLLEKQSTGAIAIPTPPPRATPAARKPAATPAKK